MKSYPDTIKYLRSKEWTMGNGQCHDCCGHKPRHKWWTDTVGHKEDCPLAIALNELGEHVVWERENHSKSRFRMRAWSKRVVNEMFRNQCEKSDH